ncbi:zinc finger RNA-binding protein isoform X2 [Toxorhynchites rutilus septentrionalis]|uniref:zinc finger RNA-binding protein isoform X2 n=1 Tax=Toxorhynchites rutilus septentrionalis TaxID=329112 RepID=UPI00247938CF|nr:zinc finger RNA-binding protein isoform X2 [Toxorhynchites rutilus septentrionalis]
MATNNYFGFPHGATQYGTTATGTAYPTTQTGYAVATAAAPAAAASYGTAAAAAAAVARPPGYDQAYQTAATPGTYANSFFPTATATAATYDYGYGRTTQTYDTSKTYYQQAGATAAGYTAAATAYDPTGAGAAKVINFQPATQATYAAQPARATIQTAKTATQYTGQPQAYVPQTSGYSQTVTTVNAAPKSAVTAQTVAQNTNTYSGYETALYSAATMYVAQQQSTKPTNPLIPGQQGPAGGGWQGYKKGNHMGMHPYYKPRNKPPKPQPIHYCDVCKISCAGPQTYREHLEGQKHKKRELLLKQATEPGTATPARPPNSLHCELCDVTCTGNDAYAAHVRGAKHQKVVKLHTKLGKPIPACDPAPNTDEKKDGDTDEHDENVKPVGSEYIEEIKDDEGKLVSFNCKLCECKFNDPNAKEMHMKGRRHRLQYKKKVQPDLFVDIKPTLKQKKMAEARAHRQAMQEEYWNRRRMAEAEMDDSDHGMRQFGRHPFFGMLPGRRPESSDDRHVVARHADIYPKEEELQTIQRIVSHTERALKMVSDAMTVDASSSKDEKKDNETEKKDSKNEEQNKADSNQMISFLKEAEGGNVRLLKGVMRVGLLAKGLLLHGDNTVQLVVLCAEKPTTSLLKRVITELPIQLKKVTEEHKYTVTMAPVEGAVMVSDGAITVKISLTSPLLREEANSTAEQIVQSSEDLLPREPCLQALAALRHAKWFQARATGLQSCVMIMRIMRDLCQRIPIWGHITQWAMELLIEKVISSAGGPLTPGECMRRVMEAIASSILINGPGLLDPCEKEPEDALAGLSKQQREDITISAQMFLRFIAFRQIHKVLGMEPLPPPKFVGNRNWRFNRKRRRSGTEGADSEADGKMVKKEENKGESGTNNAAMDLENESGK